MRFQKSWTSFVKVCVIQSCNHAKLAAGVTDNGTYLHNYLIQTLFNTTTNITIILIITYKTGKGIGYGLPDKYYKLTVNIIVVGISIAL